MHPNLGVVSPDPHRSFVIADIPGLIEGAADGAGLGTRFLKHLSRTRILLHMIDIMPDDASDPVESAEKILHELQKYSDTLYNKPRWLILNKTDLLPPEEAEAQCQRIIDALDWQGPIYKISAISGENTRQLSFDMMNFIEEMRENSPQLIDELLNDDDEDEFANIPNKEDDVTIAPYEQDDYDDDYEDDNDISVVYTRE